MLGAVERHAGDAAFDAVVNVLEFRRIAAVWFGADFDGGTAWHGDSPSKSRGASCKLMLARSYAAHWQTAGFVRNEFAGLGGIWDCLRSTGTAIVLSGECERRLMRLSVFATSVLWISI